MKLLIVLGTRPEAIKLAPLIQALRREKAFRTTVCATAQHRLLLDSALDVFGIRSDVDLGLMEPDQTLFQLTAKALVALENVLVRAQPDLILVQGDTTSALAGALAGFYRRIPIAHVEAGLRSGDLYAPFPEEANRKLVDHLSHLHFAPTALAAGNLRQEGIPEESIHITGNTGVDAVRQLMPQLVATPDRLQLGFRLNEKPYLLVTCHRRESQGRDLLSICLAIRQIADRNPQFVIVFPMHPNPAVRSVVERELAGLSCVRLIEPLDYLSFLALLRGARLALTDSGGVQEEAPEFKVPVLVLRNQTERREGIEANLARLVGTQTVRIVQETERLLRDEKSYGAMQCAQNPYGDGRASERIVAALKSYFKKG